jgi:tetratricopeptide (TPR) repeat protein
MNLLIRHFAGLLVLAVVLGGGPAPVAAQENKDREALLAAYRQGEKLKHQGQYSEAIKAYEKAVALADRVFGANDSTTANLLNNLAMLYHYQGQYAKAEPLFRRSLKIRESRLGKDHPAVAESLNNLAGLYQGQAQFDKAEPLFQRSLEILESKLGKDDPIVAQILNNLAFLYKAQAQYAKAEPFYQRSLKIFESKLGKDHPQVATCLNNLARLYQDQGQYAKAEPLFHRSRRILEFKRGKNHPDVATILNNLAGLYQDQGQFAKAEPLYQRSLKIREARLGKDHADVAFSLYNLATIYQEQGQFAKAEPLFRQSLKIRESRLGPDHPDVAASLHNLGGLYQEQGRYANAEPLYQRSLKILESKLGKDHPDVANSLNSLAAMYAHQGQYANCKPLFERSLRIFESKLGRDHPDFAATLNNLAWLYHEQGQYAKAQPLYEDSLKIRKSKVSKEHPQVATGLNNLADLCAARRRWQDAARYFDDARRGQRAHVYQVMRTLVPREQLLYLHEKVNRDLFRSLSLARLRPQEAGLAERSAGWLINGKALTQQALAEPLLLARAANQPELEKLLGQLIDSRKQLAQLTLALPRPGQEKQRLAQLEALSRQEKQLSRELGQKSGQLLESPPWVELAAVRKALPANAVFIDIARIPVFNFQAKGTEQRWQTPRYVSWIIPPENKGRVQLIDLGEAAKIEAAVAILRPGLQKPPALNRASGDADAEKELAGPRKALAQLIVQPLLPHIARSRCWIISPDASLWLVPWAALPLPDGSFSVEKYTISQVISGRDLVAPKADDSRFAKPKLARPLVLADPDFDLLPARAEEGSPLVRGLLTEETLPRFARLPGTAAEARAIAPLLQRYGKVKPEVLTGKAALEQSFKAARRPRVLVLSTHGYFLADQADVAPPLSSDLASRGLKMVTNDLPRSRGKVVKALENPLLRCGLALVGANQRDKAPEGADDGILTGLEIVGTDLRGTELVVLSACETGLGQVNVGEGVAGLRQAFQLAGAQSVVATLWQIPDKETTALMTAFFEHLAAKMGKAEALRLAQLRIVKERRAKGKAAHPFYWAAFTLTGR